MVKGNSVNEKNLFKHAVSWQYNRHKNLFMEIGETVRICTAKASVRNICANIANKSKVCMK
jgi:hypothetical protein